MSRMKILIISVILYCSLMGISASDCMKSCSEESINVRDVYAKLDEAVSVYFCVHCEQAYCRFLDEFVFSHRNYRSGWRSFNDTKDNLIFKNINRGNTAAVSITLQRVTDADFNTEFTMSLRLHPKYCRFQFRLIRQQDGVTSEASKDRDNRGMISETSAYSVSTIAKQITIPSTTPTTVAQKQSTGSTKATTTLANDKTRCQPPNNSMCPQMFVPVDGRLCLLVIPRSSTSEPEKKCADFGADLPDLAIVTNAKTCLEKLLNENHYKIIPLRNKTTWNVRDWIQGGSNSSYYPVVCSLDINKFAPPVINSFFVTRRDRSNIKTELTLSLLDSTQTFVTISQGETLNITCEASGYPVPNVTITGVRENVPPITRTSTAFFKSADCVDSGVYTCHAENFLNSTQTQKRIIVSREPLQGNSHHKTNSEDDKTSIAIVVLLAVLIFIVVIVSGVFGYRCRAVKRQASSRIRNTNDSAVADNRQDSCTQVEGNKPHAEDDTSSLHKYEEVVAVSTCALAIRRDDPGTVEYMNVESTL